MTDRFSEMAERVLLDMESYALRQSIDGRRRVLADALRAAHARGVDEAVQAERERIEREIKHLVPAYLQFAGTTGGTTLLHDEAVLRIVRGEGGE